jgi:hypothetical protein
MQPLLHLGEKRKSIPAREIGRVVKSAGRQFERPWRSDTDSRALAPVRVGSQQLEDGIAHVVHDGKRACLEACAERYGFQYATIRLVCGDPQTCTA